MAEEAYELDVPGTEQLVDVDHNISATHASGSSDIILIPQPTSSPRDPLTWSRTKKYWHLFLLALYACAFSFGENTLGAAWETVSQETGVSIVNMNGGSALNYLLLGFVNIFWIPTAMKIGRRPVFLITILIDCCSMIWIGAFNGVASWMLAMVLMGVGTAAYQAVIQLSVFDMFFAHERGRMLAVYLFGQQLGSILGLITGGSIADGPGWRWSQYICAIIDASVLFIFIFAFEETLFPRFLFKNTASAFSQQIAKADPAVLQDPEGKAPEIDTSSRSSDSDPPTMPARTYTEKLKPWVYFPEDRITFWQYFRRPFLLFTIPNVVIAGVMFAFGCTAGIVSFNTISEILTEPPYNWSTTSTGLAFFAALIGNFVGWGTGVLSDYVVLFCARRNSGVKEPEQRLWTVGLSFIYAAFGYQLYGWTAETGGSWVGIVFGIGFMISHQVSICSIATAYAMECFPGISGELVVVLAVCSSCINFAISYSVQPFIEAAGYGFTFLFFGLCVLASMLMAIPTIMYGKSWRRKAAPRWRAWLAERERQDLAH